MSKNSPQHDAEGNCPPRFAVDGEPTPNALIPAMWMALPLVMWGLYALAKWLNLIIPLLVVVMVVGTYYAIMDYTERKNK